MLTGKIKNWDSQKGWGFIEGDDGNDYFAHASKVRSGQNIRLGLRVKFDIFETSRGSEAENITLY